MKKSILSVTFILLILTQAMFTSHAQEWKAGLDIYSSYVWRGTKFGSGPAFQPSIEFSAGSFSIGAWGSYSASVDESPEADLYAWYELSFGETSSLILTVTDYYFPGTSWLEKESHFIEPLATLNLGVLSLTGAYMMNSGEGDVYLEAGFTAGDFTLFVGGGDGAYSTDGDFNLCNIGIGASKEIPITDTFSLPISGAAILNPSSEQFHIVVGISL